MRLSSRHVQALIGGEVVADSHRPVLVFETGLVSRYYLPIENINQDVLIPSERKPVVLIREWLIIIL